LRRLKTDKRCMSRVSQREREGCVHPREDVPEQQVGIFFPAA
jgi:hypothetical protein